MTLALRDDFFKDDIFKSVFEDASDGMWILHDRKLMMCNNSAAHLLGYKDPDDLQNLHPAEISPRRQLDGQWSSEKAHEMMSIARHNGHHRFTWQHLHKDGSRISMEVSLNVVHYKHLRPLHVVWRDVSEDTTDSRNRISHREQECLIWTALGKTSAQTAEILSLSEQTINNYLASATRKLHANNRTQAVAIAYEQGLLKRPNKRREH
ncbi:MAG: PAS domain-containing protein [Roseibium sp.]|nr:PAS domain-containing protein [Roseibium sp.]